MLACTKTLVSLILGLLICMSNRSKSLGLTVETPLPSPGDLRYNA